MGYDANMKRDEASLANINRAYTGGSSCPDESPREISGPISNKLLLLEETNHALHCLVGEAEKRLVGVLCPLPPPNNASNSGASPAPPPGSMSMVLERLSHSIYELQQLGRRVSELISRVEV